MKSRSFLLLILSFVALSVEAGNVYRYVDQKGRVSFSDRKQHAGFVPMVQSNGGWEELRAPTSVEEGAARYRSLVLAAATRYDLSPALLSAVIHVESRYNPVAVSENGDIGLMQINASVAARYEIGNPQDPKQNIDAGARYLKELMENFGRKTDLVLAAYDAGPQVIIDNDNRMPSAATTKRYVREVLALYRKYQNMQTARY